MHHNASQTGNELLWLGIRNSSKTHFCWTKSHRRSRPDQWTKKYAFCPSSSCDWANFGLRAPLWDQKLKSRVWNWFSSKIKKFASPFHLGAFYEMRFWNCAQLKKMFVAGQRYVFAKSFHSLGQSNACSFLASNCFLCCAALTLATRFLLFLTLHRTRTTTIVVAVHLLPQTGTLTIVDFFPALTFLAHFASWSHL